MAARMVSIYASDDRVKVQSISEKAKILEVKAQAKVALKEKLGMGDESFHPTAQSDDDVRVIGSHSYFLLGVTHLIFLNSSDQTP